MWSLGRDSFLEAGCIDIASDKRLEPDTARSSALDTVLVPATHGEVSHNILLNGSGKAGSWRICLHEFVLASLSNMRCLALPSLSLRRPEKLTVMQLQARRL